jgi:hypothetical protein
MSILQTTIRSTLASDTATDYPLCSTLSIDSTSDFLLFSGYRYVSRRSRLWISRCSLPAACRRSRLAVSCWHSRRWVRLGEYIGDDDELGNEL